MLPRCSDLLASPTKASLILAAEEAAKAQRINNRSLEVSETRSGCVSMMLYPEQKYHLAAFSDHGINGVGGKERHFG